MMTEPKAEPTGELSADAICEIIEGQIAQQYDSMRMQASWERILGGATSPKVIAQALVRELSFGRYQRSGKQLSSVVHVYVSGACDPMALSAAVAQGIRKAAD